jgi:hypothetical protein
MKTTKRLTHSAALLAILIGSAALADTNLPVVCADATKAGRPAGECAYTAQSFNRAGPTTLVRHCVSVTACTTFAQRTWRPLGEVPASEFVEVCIADKAPGSPIVGGNCSTTNTVDDWAQMRLVSPSEVASSSSSSGTFTVTPAEGYAPLSAVIAWNVPGATTCTAGGSWTGGKAASGSQTVTNLTANATYTLVCSKTSTSSSGSVRLSWTAPTQNTDGTALTDLAGYRILHGSSASALSSVVQVPNAGLSSFLVDGLPIGTRYFAVRAYTSDGRESANSNVASKTIAGSSSTVEIFNASRTVTVRARPDPNPPTGLVVEEPIAGITDVPVFNVSANNTRGTAILGFIEAGSPCLEPGPVYTYRSKAYFRVPRANVKWWASSARDNVAAPCKRVELEPQG